MMHMTFYWGRNVTVLFDFWKTDTWTEYSLTLLACFLFSLFYQYLEDRRLALRSLSLSSKPTAVSSAETPLILSPKRIGGRWANRVAGSSLFGVSSALGYMLMLAIMSFNGGVFVAVVVGLSAGYFLFRCSDDDEAVVLESPCACA